MSLEIIQEKINKGEGLIEVEKELMSIQNFNKKTENNKEWQKTIITKVFTKHDYKIINDELVLKDSSDKKTEINIKIQQKILNKMQPLLIAIASQEAGLKNGADKSGVMLTTEEIKDIINYVGKIAKGDISAIFPELSESIKKLTGV